MPFDQSGVVKICGGGGHVLVLTSNGKIFSCGWNNKGQLGNARTTDVNQFEEVVTVENVKFKEIAAGWDSSAAISTEGQLYVWGSNSFNQLGVSNKIQSFSMIPIPIVLPENEKRVKSVALGLRHTCILTESNILFFLGRSKCIDSVKELKSAKTLENCLIRLDLNENIDQISCGQNHVMIKTSDNRLLLFGDNKFKQCGENGNIGFDSEDPDDEIKEVASGWTHNAFLNKRGEIFTWGRNNYGQLGIGISHQTESSSTPLKLCLPPTNSRAFNLRLGSEHGIARTEDGEVITWGWNEHGNCGNNSTQNVYVDFAKRFFCH